MRWDAECIWVCMHIPNAEKRGVLSSHASTIHYVLQSSYFLPMTDLRSPKIIPAGHLLDLYNHSPFILPGALQIIHALKTFIWVCSPLSGARRPPEITSLEETAPLDGRPYGITPSWCLSIPPNPTDSRLQSPPPQISHIPYGFGKTTSIFILPAYGRWGRSADEVY